MDTFHFVQFISVFKTTSVTKFFLKKFSFFTNGIDYFFFGGGGAGRGFSIYFNIFSSFSRYVYLRSASQYGFKTVTAASTGRHVIKLYIIHVIFRVFSSPTDDDTV